MSRHTLRYMITGAAALAVATAAAAGEVGERIEAALAVSDRPASDVERDPDRKPGKVLAFYDVEPGETVVDLFSSSGYYTELFSHLVGPDGKVYAHNGPSRYERNKESLDARYERLGNVQALPADISEGLPLEDDSVDDVYLFLLYHHFHYDEEAPDSVPEHTKTLFAEVKRVLKPGGTFGLIEHDAVASASRAQSAEWHRVPVDMAKADLEAAGFIFSDESSVLMNDTDPRNSGWRDIRGKTARWVLKYESPE